MAGKKAAAVITAYLAILGCLYWYLFNGADTAVPDQWKGTAADPAVFMNAKEQVLSSQYSAIRNFLYFASILYEWLIYFFILLFGVSRIFSRWADLQSKWRSLKTAVYLFWLSLLTYALTFPISYISYRVSRNYGISTQEFSSWMRDGVIDFWLQFGEMLIIAAVLYWLINKSPKRWWLYSWFLSVPFTVFMMFIQPVIIDPLYNDFYPLQNKELETKILELAGRADISADHVYEVNMAEKTNALNAYVTGIGSNSRIVLWDTALNTLKEKEILVIMAHEMGHYAEKHIYFGIAGSLLMSLAGLWITAKLMGRTVRKHGGLLNIKSEGDISSLPLLLLITSVLLFLSSPLSNAVSRYEEKRADHYAMEMLNDKESTISMFQTLAKTSLSEVNPPQLVKWFRYTHPTLLERMRAAANFEKQKE